MLLRNKILSIVLLLAFSLSISIATFHIHSHLLSDEHGFNDIADVSSDTNECAICHLIKKINKFYITSFVQLVFNHVQNIEFAFVSLDKIIKISYFPSGLSPPSLAV